MKAQTVETVAQILALQQFLQLNTAAFATVSKAGTASGVTVSGINGSALMQGAPVLTFVPNSIQTCRRNSSLVRPTPEQESAPSFISTLAK
jgi:hypothetical protein